MPNKFRQALQQSESNSKSGNRFKAALQKKKNSFVHGLESDAKSFMGGLTDLAGFPMDMINPVLSAAGLPKGYGTSNDFRNLAAKHGLTYKAGNEPNTFGNHLSRFLGSMALPQASIEAKAGQYADKAPEALSFGENAIRSLTAPDTTARLSEAGRKAGGAVGKRVGAGEAGAKAGSAIGATVPHANALIPAVGAAGGGKAANAIYPNNPTAEAIGEFAGGLAPTAVAFGPTGLAIKGGRYALSKAAPFTKEGAMPRAARRLQASSENAAQSVARQDPENFVPGTNLTPARRSGDPTHLAIEKTVLDQQPQTRKTVNETNDRAAEAAGQHAQMGGDPAHTRSVLDAKRKSTLNKLHNKAQSAAEAGMDEVSNLPPAERLKAVNQAARKKIEDAKENAQQTIVEPLWNKIPKNTPATLDHARQALKALHEQHPGRPELVGVPKDIQDQITKDSPITFNGLRKLRTSVRHHLTSAKSGLSPKGDPVHDMGQLYDALTQDIDSTPGYGQAAQKARLASKEVADRFNKGIIGQISGIKRTGDQSVAPEDTVQHILSGTTKGTHVREALNAVPELAPEIKDYLRSSFLMNTTDNGKFNPGAARTFMKKHANVLDELPGLKKEFSNLHNMRQRSDALYKRYKNTDKLAHDARKSRTALYLNAPLGKEWKAVLSSHDPAAAATHLYRKVQHDEKAKQGLKSSFIEHLFKSAATGGTRDSGHPMISGNRLHRLMTENQKVMDSLHFTGSEKKRLQQSVNTLSVLEKKAESGEPINTDNPSMVMQSLVRVLGARAGGQLSKDSAGGSIQSANILSNNARRMLQHITLDKASSLISDAVVNDPKLYKALMTGPTESIKKRRQAQKIIMPWIITPVATSQESK